MPSRNLWDKNVPRVEYDHRARDTCLRLEHLERLLGKRVNAGEKIHRRAAVKLHHGACNQGHVERHVSI